MCRKLCFLICFAIAASLVSDFTQASVLSNGGFEDGTWTSESSMPTNWWKWGDASAWSSWKNNSSQAHSGSKFICVGGNNLSQFADFGEDVFNIRAGAIYLFDAWVKTESWGSPTAKLKVEFKNKSNVVIRTDQITLFTGQKSTWEKYTLETAPAPAGVVRANIICEGAGEGSVWFDDIYVIPAPVTDGTDLLVNSGFENGNWTSQTDTPNNWWKWSDSWGWAGWQNDSDYARTGSKFISMGGNNYNEFAVFGQDVTGLSAGKIYVFSAWVRAESIWWGWPTAELYVEFKNSSNQVLRTDTLNLFAGRNPDWNWYNLVTDPAPAGTARANFVCYAEGEGTMWFDDVKVTVYVPEIAKNPEPRNNDENVNKNIVLSWVAGNGAVSHNVYFGTSFSDVNNANTSSSQYKDNQSFGNDTYDPPGDLEFGKTYYWRIDEVGSTSTYKGDVWSFAIANLEVLHVDASQTYQEMDGFGGDMTESSAYLLKNYMTSAQRQAAMNALFDYNTGIGLSYLRQPIGSSDFRLVNDYTYDDMPAGQTDYSLVNFSIARDMNCIIPLLQQASTINPDLKIIASPWSPPAWMKTNSSLYDGGYLIDSNAIYNTYADYFVKYVQAYEAQGLVIDAVTLQNEPGCIPVDYPGMQMTVGDHIRLAKVLGPKFSTNGIDTKLVIWDWGWDNTDYAIEVLNDSQANQWIAGTAFHGYSGVYQKQSVVKDAHPDKDIYLTEDTGALNGDFEDDLMRFTSNLIIGSVRNWSRCVIMWNLALNDSGGPKIGEQNNCRGIITVNQSTGEITKNAEYYVLGHASKFVKPGAVRIGSSEPAEKIGNVAFQNPDGSIVVITLNENTGSRDFRMEWNGQAFSTTLPGRSVTTFKWPNQTNATVGVWMTTADKSKLLAQQANLQFAADTATVIHLNMSYSEKQQANYSGAACLKMALDYEGTNSYTQSSLHSYGIAHNSTANLNGSYIDPQGMWLTMNNYEVYSNYNYSELSRATRKEAYHNICYWLSYAVPGVTHQHMPAMIPTGGNYENWVIVNGFSASDNPLTASGYTVYGFWTTDPYASGIGQNAYKTAAELSGSFVALSTFDTWNGKYVTVCEPPAHQAQITIAEPVSYKDRISSKQDIIDAAITGIENNLSALDEKFDNAYAGSHPGKPMLVRSDNGNYFIVPFLKNAGCSVAVIVDAKNGAFRQVSYSGVPDVKYLKQFEKTKTPKINKVNGRNKNDFLPNADKVELLSD
jgi:glucosylceramidase